MRMRSTAGRPEGQVPGNPRPAAQSCTPGVSRSRKWLDQGVTLKSPTTTQACGHSESPRPSACSWALRTRAVAGTTGRLR